MEFETRRLLIRRFTEADAEALYVVLSDPEVMRYIEPPFSLEQTRAFLRDAGLCAPPLVYASPLISRLFSYNCISGLGYPAYFPRFLRSARIELLQDASIGQDILALHIASATAS